MNKRPRASKSSKSLFWHFNPACSVPFSLCRWCVGFFILFLNPLFSLSTGSSQRDGPNSSHSLWGCKKILAQVFLTQSQLFSLSRSSFVSIFHLLCVVRLFPSCVPPEERASLLAYSHLLKGQLLHYTQSLCEEEIPHVLSATQRKPSQTVCPFAWKSLLLWYKYFSIFKLVSSKK